jgi:hypothetical protein
MKNKKINFTKQEREYSDKSQVTKVQSIFHADAHVKAYRKLEEE